MRTGELPWPPPGLARLAGRLRAPAVRTGVGGALLALPLALAIDAGGAATLDPNGPEAGALGVLVLLGVALLAAGGLGLLRLCWTLGRASAEGYAAGTVLEVLADRRGDTGELIAGRGRFAGLPPARRSRLRRGRVLAAALAFGAALLPVPLVVLYVALAARGIVPGSATLATAGPPLVLLLIATILRAGERFSTSRAAGSAGPSRSPEPGPEPDTAEAWYARPEAVDDARPARRPGPGWALAGAAAGVVAGASFLLLLVPLYAIMAFGGDLLPFGIADAPFYAERSRVAELARRYRVPPDTSVTPQEAGRLARTAGEAVILDEACGHRLYARASRVGAAAFEHEELDFDAADRACLESFAAFSGWSSLSRMAGAARLDLWASEDPDRFRSELGGLLFPRPRYLPVRHLSGPATGLAALDMSRGRPDEAERRLREIASLGILLADHSRTDIEELVGVLLANQAVHALQGFYRHAGREEERRTLELARDSAHAAADDEWVTYFRRFRRGRPGPRARRADLLRLLADQERRPGARWDAVGDVELLRCTNVGEHVLGLGRDVADARAAARPTLVRYPGGQAYFDGLTRPGLGPGAFDELTRAFEQAQVSPPAVAELGWLRLVDRVLGTPGLGTCMMLRDMTAAVQ